MPKTATIIEVAFAHYDEAIPLSPLPKALSERQFKRWKSRCLANFLLGKLFEKHQLVTQLLDHIQLTTSGRPFVAHPNIDFNISHSGDWVAVILCKKEAATATPKKCVGIDIEHPQRSRRYADLLKHYANPEEIEGLLHQNHTPFTALIDRFYLSWCIREAVLKSQGVGIVKLSEVCHLPQQRLIESAHCPTGKLCFYHQLPFYLCYFYEAIEYCQPKLMQWQQGKWQTIDHIEPLVYQVNPQKADN
ncbi:4'-phosphopantetheinyl transferase family protein [[Haemophilus] ducreyi]|uniref:4'-phosphopantetheinyl transferase family protein n=1 Tax=Haemophilus ducreyi TaxID=730 RepID=UPI0006566BAC|nr:4'-phosphopantetheinyl transferase superfamily protein [[Haemophilus] ducreyi]AKO45196.1 4'-phosphopantetheinyl transferase [[Haemophilus] ducreyi]